MPKIKNNPNKKDFFQKKTGILVKILLPLLCLGLPVLILSYSDFIAKSLTPYLPEKTLQNLPLFIKDIEFQTRIILIFTLVLGLLVGVLISRHFSRSLEKISAGLKKVLEGDLAFKIKIESRDEVGEVVHLLNKTVENLKESRQALIEREKELREKSLELLEKVKNMEASGQEVEKARLATLNILEDVEGAREELEGEKERIEAIVVSLVDGLLVLQDSEILVLNPSAEKILNVKREKILGKPSGILSGYPNLKILTQFIKKNTKRPISREELIFQKPERVFQITVISVARDQDLVVLHDVTREKIIEQMKTEFVSLTAHQLRTPLSAIKWTLRMILDGDLGKVVRTQKDFLQKTYQSNERMIELINNLLNVARIEEGRFLYKLSFVQIEDMVRSVINSYLRKAKERKISLKFIKEKKKFPKIKVDAEKLSLAIQNLVDNAIRYTPSGGRVTVALKSDKKEVECSVEDSGIGIPKGQQNRVFSKFFRGANAMRTETEGSGLGLFIAKNVIEAHGGKIWFESEENKGTTFYFILPLKTI